MTESWSARYTRFMHTLHAWLTARTPTANGFLSQPEPQTVGSFNRGRQLIAGNLMFAGHLVEAGDRSLWDIPAPDDAFAESVHGFGWLDDLAAVGDARARALAQTWLWGWIERHEPGFGPGWTPDLAGRRLIRWIQHAVFLLAARDAAQAKLFYKSLAHQAAFVRRRWPMATPGMPRMEALTGMLHAGLALEGLSHLVAPAQSALDTECRTQVDARGGISTRNPAELLEILTLLTWARAALESAGHDAREAHLSAIERIAPTLRYLRHTDGSLARFHGGGRGMDGRLDHALAAAGIRCQTDGPAMGYARLSGGRTSVIIDAAPPPRGGAAFNAHASTLAIEVTSGRRPLIVNCGSGAYFGEAWRRAGRATPSHSALAIEGYSSARLGREGRIGGARREMLEDGPRDVPSEMRPSPDGTLFEGAHDGYKSTHGLTHARVLELTDHGRNLLGEDMLFAIDRKDKQRMDRSMPDDGGIPFHVRFHLHPDVDSEIDLGGKAVSLALRSGEIWVFRHEGGSRLSLEPSVYLEAGRLRPRATKQIVLTHHTMGYATRIRWSLAKAHDTAIAIRDFEMDDDVIVND